MNNNNKEQRKKELKDKVKRLSKTVKELKPYKGMSLEYSISMVERWMYMANINALKEFMIDNDCQGEKPRFMRVNSYQS